MDHSPSNENEKADKWNSSSACKKKQNKVFRFNSRNRTKLTYKRNTTWPITSLNMRKMDYSIDREQTKRKINKEPYKVLDAPNLIDDYYLNLLDWSSDNVLAIGLDNAVYIWRACNSKVEKLCEVPDTDQIASVSWS